MGNLNRTTSLDIADIVRNRNLKEAHLHNILKASAIINSKLELNHVLKQVIRHATKLTKSVAASIILTNDSDDDLVIAYSTDLTSRVRFPRTKGVAGLCVSTGQIKVVHDAKRSSIHFTKIDESTGFETKTILCVPLSIRGKIIGCLELMNKRDGTMFNDDDIAIASIMSNLAAVSIKNAESHERLQTANLAMKTHYHQQT